MHKHKSQRVFFEGKDQCLRVRVAVSSSLEASFDEA